LLRGEDKIQAVASMRGGFVVVAAAVHMAVLLALPRGRARPQAVDDDPVSAPEWDLDVDALESPVSPPARAAVAQAPSHTMGAIAIRERAPRETPSSATPRDETAPGLPEPAGVHGGEPRPWTFDPRAPFDPMARDALAGAARGVVAAGATPGREGIPAGATTSGGVAEGLDARDAALGLGRGGPVISALERAAAASDAPFEGSATFDVGIDTSGHVSVALLDSSSSDSGWARMAAAARAAIDPSRVRIPPGARGWRVVARVEAKVQYPNGVDPKKLGNSVEASPGRLVEDKNRPDAHAPPIVFEKVPGVTLAHRGKVCSASVTLGLVPGISGGCDPANIGMNPLRVVRGHVVSEGRF
jgi:hypothetical protein